MFKRAAVLTALILCTCLVQAYAEQPWSGIAPGAPVRSFHSLHLAGPDKGSRECPVCKYGEFPAVQAWVYRDDPANVVALMKTLQAEVDRSPRKLKAFVVFIGGDAKKIQQMAATNKIERVGIIQVSKTDKALQDYGLRAVDSLRNVVFIYRLPNLGQKFVNLKMDAAGSKSLRAALQKMM